MPLNRVVALATAALTLILAVIPVVGNFDWTSTAGIIAGIIAILGIVNRWLAGWSSYETAEVHKNAAALAALGQGAEIPGATEGAKAEGFQPPEA
jgi:hypothetical protein